MKIPEKKRKLGKLSVPLIPGDPFRSTSFIKTSALSVQVRARYTGTGRSGDDKAGPRKL